MLLIDPLLPGVAAAEEFFAFVCAYLELLSAFWAAQEQNLSVREMAVIARRFRDLRVGQEVLLWMLFQGHVEHLVAPATPLVGGHSANCLEGVHIGESSFFSLTETGVVFAEWFLSRSLTPGWEVDFAEAREVLRTGTLAPRY